MSQFNDAAAAQRRELTGPDGRVACYLAGDGKEHDEAFTCDVCEEPVCGICADAGNGSEWFCPSCAEAVEEESDAA